MRIPFLQDKCLNGEMSTNTYQFTRFCTYKDKLDGQSDEAVLFVHALSLCLVLRVVLSLPNKLLWLRAGSALG